jgi:predicted metal-dependent hydrolase
MAIKINESILLSIIIIFIYILYLIKKNRLTLVESNNNVKFMVYNDRNKVASANLLSELVDKMYKLRNNLIKNKQNYEENKQYIDLLEENFNQDRTSIYENAPDSDLTSYSVNKGEELAFCLRSKKTGNFHDINLLMYVAIHEMAHMACPEIGHGDLFKKIFRFLILEAINFGLYKKVDYQDNPVEYCGMILSSSIV